MYGSVCDDSQGVHAKLEEVLERDKLDLLLLVLNVLFFMGAYAAFLKYDMSQG